MACRDIPIIDIAPLRENKPDRLKDVAEQLHRACQDIGFFYIKNHNISPQIIDNTFVHANAFFSRPLTEKMKVAMQGNSECFRGYSPAFSELADGERNACELMEFSVDLERNHPDVIKKKPMHGPNLWPDMPGYKDAIVAYINSMIELGFDLMSGIAIGLNLPDDYFYNAFNGRSFWQFRTTHYPDPTVLTEHRKMFGEDPKLSTYKIGDYSCGAHTDYGCLTILLANNPGLEVQRRDGKWIEAEAIPGTFICNIGDMLSYWTKNLYVATMHRVRSEKLRISLPFFFQPDYETVVRPIQSIETDACGTFAPFQYGPYAFSKFKGIYPDSREM